MRRVADHPDYSTMQNRIGRFVVSMQQLEDDPSLATRIKEFCVVKKRTPMPMSGLYEYLAYCQGFRAVAADEEPPWYDMVITAPSLFSSGQLSFVEKQHV